MKRKETPKIKKNELFKYFLVCQPKRKIAPAITILITSAIE